jgi:RNA polymerase sigma factor (TIGR02999 family)
MCNYNQDLAQILLDWNKQDPSSTDRLFSVIYRELHELAERFMQRERQGHTLQATALVSEVYLKLIDQRCVQWQNRAHFFGVAAQLMRRILVKHAEKHRAVKRGGGRRALRLEDLDVVSKECSADLLALDHALTELARIDPRQSRIVEMRFFAGLNIDEIGAVLNLSPATIKREWRIARAWLYGAVIEAAVPSEIAA